MTVPATKTSLQFVNLNRNQLDRTDVLNAVDDHLSKLSRELGGGLEAQRAGVDGNVGEGLEHFRISSVRAIVEENSRGESRLAGGRCESRDNVTLRVGNVGSKGRDSLFD